METKELKIQIPEGMEIDKENSTFECIKFKPIEFKKTWENIGKFTGYYLNGNSLIKDCGSTNDSSMSFNRCIAASARVVKSMLAMAQLSQVLKKWYKPFTDEEWKEKFLCKYIIAREGEELKVFLTNCNSYHFLAFRADIEAHEFLENNKELIKQYFML